VEFLVEYIKKSEKLTVKELDERFDGDYERAIDVLGLSKENWAEFVGEFGKIVEKKTFNKVSEVEEEIGAELPEDIRYDSGSNGYDMFWNNYKCLMLVISLWWLLLRGLLVELMYSLR